MNRSAPTQAGKQHIPKANGIYRFPVLFLLLFLLLAYLPVFLPFFHIKNDLVTQNLPTRFFVSESIHAGSFPWWNPYISYGIPQYGDMNNGFWNPVQWLLASTFGYDLLVITLEEMFYIFLGGLGIFYLLKKLRISADIALMTAVSYMACGYILGHLQHFCWITGTAFFPYLLLYMVKINQRPTIGNYVAGSIFVFLFLASTHPGLVIGAMYFLLFIMITAVIYRRELGHWVHPKFFRVNGLFLLTGLLFSTVVIVSNLDALSHIGRGAKVSLEESLQHPTSLQSYLSLLFPLAVHKGEFFNTDISMRNVYAGLAGLFGFLLFLKLRPVKFFIPFIAALLFFILLSAGGWFKMIAYEVVPLTGYVRLNGEFTYFVILLLLTGAAAGLHAARSDKNQFARKLLTILLFIAVIAFLVSVFTLVFLDSAFFTFSGALPIFHFISQSTIWDLLLIQAMVQIIFLLLLRRNWSDPKRVLVLTAWNLVLISWMVLPFTGLGSLPRKDVQAIIDQAPGGIFIPALVPVNEARLIDSRYYPIIDSPSMYSKQPASRTPPVYPVQLKNASLYYADTALVNYINSQSYFFLTSDTVIGSESVFDSASIIVNDFKPGYGLVTVTNRNSNWLVFLQNNYPYWETYVDGKKVNHVTVHKTFIAVPVEKGMHKVEFIFNPRPVRTALWISLSILAIGLCLIIIPRTRNRILFR